MPSIEHVQCREAPLLFGAASEYDRATSLTKQCPIVLAYTEKHEPVRHSSPARSLHYVFCMVPDNNVATTPTAVLPSPTISRTDRRSGDRHSPEQQTTTIHFPFNNRTKFVRFSRRSPSKQQKIHSIRRRLAHSTPKLKRFVGECGTRHRFPSNRTFRC
jgi:hypothetical protein